MRIADRETEVKRDAFTAVAALLLASGAAMASEWVQAGTGKDGTRVLVDTSSIAITGPVRQARSKMTFPVHAQH